MSAIKEVRKEKKLTQQQAAEILGISLRSYKSYENDTDKIRKMTEASAAWQTGVN